MHLGLIGYGSIAQSLIALLPVARVPHITVLVRDASLERAQSTQAQTKAGPKVSFVTSIEALLASHPTVIAECAGHAAVTAYGAQILANGTDLIVASIGAFADAALHDLVLRAALDGMARLILPSGAIGGLDLLRVLSASDTVNVTYRGIKPPAAWKGSPAEALTDLDGLQSRSVFFAGTGRQAATDFPKNANVVAALALAGAGFDDMKVELIADPAAQANTHSYEVSSPICSYQMEIENTASPGNARTSMTTVLSIRQDVLKYAV